jgi:hypothetical protein
MSSSGTTSNTQVDPKFAPVARAFARHRDVTEGRLFSAFALKVNGKIFAMFPRGRFVVKLPRSRVDELVENGNGQRFGPGKRVMKEWVAVDAECDWIALAREAYAFVKRATPLTLP